MIVCLELEHMTGNGVQQIHARCWFLRYQTRINGPSHTSIQYRMSLEGSIVDVCVWSDLILAHCGFKVMIAL